jgi:Mrp family chromosome partitioning ATPase/capsular polysaccharide biosynthesis protein
MTPGTPRDRSLLRAHFRWILGVTFVAIASAGVLTWAMYDPVFESEVRILVDPALTPAGTTVPPDMETERQVAVSGVVASAAAENTGTTPTFLQRRATVTVPAASTVLVLDYTDTTAALAQRRAQALADAYVDYRDGQARPLSSAALPLAVTGPNYAANLGAGLALGLLVAVGGALLRDRNDDSVRGAQDFIDQTGVPVLATVPVPAKRAALEVGRFAVLDEPDSRAAVAYRHLRGKVARAARGQAHAPTVTLVTSAAEDDGAARVAADTAVALALAGDTVLLVEGDLRTPRLAELFDCRVKAGLGAVLFSDVPLYDAVHPGPVPGLHLLPADLDPPVARGTFVDERTARKLLREVPPGIDHVVVLAPPVLGAAETAVFAEQAHLLVLVVRPGRTTRQDLRAALAELIDGPGTLLGGVLVQGSRRGRRRSPPDVGPARATPVGDGVLREDDDQVPDWLFPRTAYRPVPLDGGPAVPPTPRLPRSVEQPGSPVDDGHR